MAGGTFDQTGAQDQVCLACGHDPAAIPTHDLAAAVVDAARRWREFLSAVSDHPGGLDDLAARRSPDEWAAIEYGCHVRDLLSVAARRIELAVAGHDPEVGWWDPVQTAVDEFYLAQHPDAVADDIERGAAELADLLQRLPSSAWSRPATSRGEPFTVADFARSAWHEAVHHLDDARRVVPAPAV